MGVLRRGLLLSLAAGMLMVTCTMGCYEGCTADFNSAIAAAAQQIGNSTALESSCLALRRHIECLHDVEPNCDATQRQYLQSTLQSNTEDHQRTCLSPVSPMPNEEVINCGSQYMVCNEIFNSSFAPAIADHNLVIMCAAITNYTTCVERLLSVPECSQYANHAITAVNTIRSRYSTLCPESGNQNGDMARCMNGTMDCYITFNNTFYPSLQQSNMTLMCSSVSNYSNCVQTLANDPKCMPYTGQAMSSIQVLQQQHQSACGHDGGQKATECLIKFKECYQHFNDTFNPAVQRMDIHKLCESMDEYKVCSQTIPSDCDMYLGQSIQGLDRMQSQYSQYCTPENKKIFSCSQLSQCNRNLIGNLTMTGAESSMLCIVLESYFPCVDSAVSECMLSGDGVTAISFRDLGMVSSRYCRSVLTNPSIKSCMSFMQCHAALDLNNISPAMMVEGTYWCHYMESSLMCSSQLISAGQCAVQNRQDMLNNIGTLQQMTKSTCTLTTPSPVSPTDQTSTTTTTTMATTAIKDEPAVTKDKVDPEHKDDKDDGTKDAPTSPVKGKTDEQTKNPDAASALTLNVVTLTLTFIIANIFQRQS